MKKVLWFSRHIMSDAQMEALRRVIGDYEINQINKTIVHASELIDDINNSDIIAIVAPITLQHEFLKLANGKPVIMAKSERIIVDGDKVEFKFIQWDILKKIDVITEIFAK